MIVQNGTNENKNYKIQSDKCYNNSPQFHKVGSKLNNINYTIR